MFDQKEGYFRETSSDQVTEKVDAAGNVIDFSVLKVSALKEHPLEVTLYPAWAHAARRFALRSRRVTSRSTASRDRPPRCAAPRSTGVPAEGGGR